jgi:FkbM family methyltransferase
VVGKALRIIFQQFLQPPGGRVKKRIDGFMMHLDLDDGGISTPLYFSGGRELAFMAILKETVSEGMVCLDIGANIGHTTLYMLRNVGDSGFVYAIEPDPHNLELLESNVQENLFQSRCEIAQIVISDKNEEIDFWLADRPNLNSVRRTGHSKKQIKVPAYALGTFLQDRKCPDFIKMDVEGHEVKILEGGLRYFTINPCNVHILLEVHPQFYDRDNDLSAILNKYFSIGFFPKYVVSTPISQPRLFKEAAYVPSRIVHTDGRERGIYENVRQEDLIRFACRENIEGEARKIVRSFLLTRES